MASKTRYLQISDVMMFEYSMLGEGESTLVPLSDMIMETKLADGHYALVSPMNDEVEWNGEEYVKKTSPMTINTLNHFSVPVDKNKSTWYTFLDRDYSFVNQDNEGSLSTYAARTTDKVIEYTKYCSWNDVSAFKTITIDGAVRWDSARMYFVNGYDFSNVYGYLVRIYVESKTGKTFDLCDFFMNGSTALDVMKYLSSPIIFGNNIYDRYVELNVPCLYDIVNGHSQLSVEMNLVNSPNIRLEFAYILKDSKSVTEIHRSIEDAVNGMQYSQLKPNCSYSRDGVINGIIPSETINSDNIGIYVAESPDYPYIEFYGTWKGKPLDYDTVRGFNVTTKLYDKSIAMSDGVYEVENGSEPGMNNRKWVAIHEIKCSFCYDDYIVKTENYSMSQIFVSDRDDTKFYYRPMIFDETIGNAINNIQIVYTMRFVNTDDKVQFLKVGTLSMHENLNKFFAKGTSLSSSSLVPYKIVNKIVENKQGFAGVQGSQTRTKYVSVFYDSTDIVMDDNGVTYQSYGYNQMISQVPKNYKFVFKKKSTDGRYSYIDLTNGYYKLYTKASDGRDVIIEPTYSKNMNLALGEIEFNISSMNIQLLRQVVESDRKMSIVSIGDNGSMSSMFDFTYSF